MELNYMITYENRHGLITISNSYFAKLIGHATSSCYGVAGMVASVPQKVVGIFRKMPDKGITVKGDIDTMTVDLHIVVCYGVNINAIADSIVHNVKYTVEEATGIKVKKVTVHIDGIKTE